MTLSPGLRKLVLTTHVTASVGWLGAVVAFLVLAIAGLTSADRQLFSAAYPAMELIGWLVIVPACLAALLTGLINSLGSEWGLFRHYWVVVKLIITVLATIILLVHMQPISYLAASAADAAPLPDHLRPMQLQVAVDAGLALVALLVATVLSIYKPRGLTPHGRRAMAAARAGRTSSAVGSSRSSQAD